MVFDKSKVQNFDAVNFIDFDYSGYLDHKRYIYGTLFLYMMLQSHGKYHSNLDLSSTEVEYTVAIEDSHNVLFYEGKMMFIILKPNIQAFDRF